MTGIEFTSRRSESNFKAGGVGFSRKPEVQMDTLLLAPGLRTRAVVKHVLQVCPPLLLKAQGVRRNTNGNGHVLLRAARSGIMQNISKRI
jgi:hypothetical protein